MKYKNTILLIFILTLLLLMTKIETTDVNRDGKTDMKDLVIIKKKIMEETEEKYERNKN